MTKSETTKNAGQATSNLLLVRSSEQTKLAWQWTAGLNRAKYLDFASQKGYAFEEMAKDAHNMRNPFNRVKLCENVHQEVIDATYTKSGKVIQMKATGSPTEAYRADRQTAALKKLKDAGFEDGEVWVTKGDKAVKSSQVKESPVSQKRIEQASKVTVKADSSLKLIGKGALTGAATSGVITAGFQLWKLHKGETDLKNAATTVASEAGYGTVSGAAVTVFGLAAASAAAPAVAVIGGGIVVGAAANYGAKQMVKLVKWIF